MTPLERRTLARDLTRLADTSLADALDLDARSVATCPLIGITGPPGVGKSTLIARLARRRVSDAGLAILAIDPTSPISGGAILGDRIRMAELSDDPRIFIRSIATRGSADGLADNLPLLVERLAAAGFGEILLETVGVGQVEYAVRAMVDTMVLVLSPANGDQIQAMKSGIVEVPDIFAVNKADMAGADRLVAELKAIVRTRTVQAEDWLPSTVPVSAERDTGTAALSAAIEAHAAWRARQPDRGRGRAWRTEVIRGLIARRVREQLRAMTPDELEQPLREIVTVIATRLVP